MLTTKRKPATVGEILVAEFMRPLGLTQGALAEAMGVPRKHVNELCRVIRLQLIYIWLHPDVRHLL